MMSAVNQLVWFNLRRYSTCHITVQNINKYFLHGWRKRNMQQRYLPLLWKSRAFSTIVDLSNTRHPRDHFVNTNVTKLYNYVSTRPAITDELWRDILIKAELEETLSQTVLQKLWPIRLLLKITSNWAQGDAYGVQLVNSLLSFMQASEIYRDSTNNILVWSSYIAFLSHNLNCEGVTEEKIFELLENKIGNFTVPEPMIMQRLIQTYCNTSQWEKGVKLARDLPDNLPFVRCSECVIILAIKKRQFDIAFELLGRSFKILNLEMVRGTRSGVNVVSNDVVQALLDVVPADEPIIYKFMDQLAEMKIYLTDDAVKKVQKWFQREKGWLGNLSEVKKGQCAHCKQKLEMIEKIPEDSLEELRVNVRNSFFKGNYNLHLLSASEEVEEFERFLAHMKPVDVVIDGLSVALSRSRASLALLQNTVEHITQDLQLRVLMLGRKHLKRANSKKVLQFIQNHAQVFLVNDKTKDDLFILYAAMYNGPDTYFISNDFMRDHCFAVGQALGDESGRLFRTWMKTRKVTFIKKRNLPYYHLLWPSQVDMCAQYTDSTLHIPYINGQTVENYNVQYNQNYPRTMLCLTEPGFLQNSQTVESKGKKKHLKEMKR